DSPTSPSVLPRSTEKQTPSTARTKAVGVPNSERLATKCFFRPSTSSNAVTNYLRVPGAAQRDAVRGSAPGERAWTTMGSRHQPFERRPDAARPVAGADGGERWRRGDAGLLHERAARGEAATVRRMRHVGNHALDGGEVIGLPVEPR